MTTAWVTKGIDEESEQNHPKCLTTFAKIALCNVLNELGFFCTCIFGDESSSSVALLQPCRDVSMIAAADNISCKMQEKTQHRQNILIVSIYGRGASGSMWWYKKDSQQCCKGNFSCNENLPVASDTSFAFCSAQTNHCDGDAMHSCDFFTSCAWRCTRGSPDGLQIVLIIHATESAIDNAEGRTRAYRFRTKEPEWCNQVKFAH